MTFQERLNEIGVRVTNTEIRFLREAEGEIEYLIFDNWISKNLFKAFIERGFKRIEVVKKKNEYSNYANEDIRFLYSCHNWFMLADMEKKTILLYKIV